MSSRTDCIWAGGETRTGGGWDEWGTDLLDDELGRCAVDALDAGGVLGRQRRQDAGAIAPVGCEGPEIGLVRQS